MTGPDPATVVRCLLGDDGDDGDDSGDNDGDAYLTGEVEAAVVAFDSFTPIRLL